MWLRVQTQKQNQLYKTLCRCKSWKTNFRLPKINFTPCWITRKENCFILWLVENIGNAFLLQLFVLVLMSLVTILYWQRFSSVSVFCNPFLLSSLFVSRLSVMKSFFVFFLHWNWPEHWMYKKDHPTPLCEQYVPRFAQPNFLRRRPQLPTRKLSVIRSLARGRFHFLSTFNMLFLALCTNFLTPTKANIQVP